MSHLICPICLDKINIFYYKSKSCNCKIKYHLNCVYNWYKINNICIYCKKKDKKTSIDINKIKNSLLEIYVICIVVTVLFLIFILINIY